MARTGERLSAQSLKLSRPLAVLSPALQGLGFLIFKMGPSVTCPRGSGRPRSRPAGSSARGGSHPRSSAEQAPAGPGLGSSRDQTGPGPRSALHSHGWHCFWWQRGTGAGGLGRRPESSSEARRCPRWPSPPLLAQVAGNLPAMKEARVRSLGQEDPLEKRMATVSSVLVWEIPGTEQPGGV